MKKAMLAIMALCGLLLMFCILKREAVSPIQEISSLPPQEKGIGSDAIRLIERVNASRSGNRSLKASSFPIRLRQGSSTIKCNGTICWESEKNFRLIVSHRITGKELDVGSNTTGFWFWSKRMDPPAIYFCEHGSLTKSNLKTPLNPEWLIRSLNVLPLNKSRITGQSVEAATTLLYEKSRDGSDREVNYIYEIDTGDAQILSVCLALADGTPIARARFTGGKTRMEWPEEDMAMEWDISSSEKNVQLSKDLWKVPTYAQKIDLGL